MRRRLRRRMRISKQILNKSRVKGGSFIWPKIKKGKTPKKKKPE